MFLPTSSTSSSGWNNNNGNGSSNGVCYAWKDKGRCVFGDKCKFQHVTENKPTSSLLLMEGKKQKTELENLNIVKF